MDCWKSGLEEGWVALGPNPSVDKMLIKGRHVLKGVWIVGDAAWRSVWVALGGNPSVLNDAN